MKGRQARRLPYVRNSSKRTRPMLTEHSTVEELLAQAARHARGPVQLALTQEAVRLADSTNDAEKGFEARMKLIEAATWAGHPEIELVAFSWCLAWADRHPRISAGKTLELLWYY